MIKFVVFGRNGYEKKRGTCPAELLHHQCEIGDKLVEYDWDSQFSPSLRLLKSGEVIEQDAPISKAEKVRRAWKDEKKSYRSTITAGYPSQYGPVDLRDGAKMIMNGAVALGRGLDLHLLNNEVVSLDAEALRELVEASFEWEQEQFASLQAARPSALS